MGNRGIDLAQLKAQRARAEQRAGDERLLVWARQIEHWLEEPLEAGVIEEKTIKVALTGQQLILSKRLGPEGGE